MCNSTHYYTALPYVLTHLCPVYLHIPFMRTYTAQPCVLTHLQVQSSFPFMCHFPMSVMLTDSTHFGSCHVCLEDVAVWTAKLSLSVTLPDCSDANRQRTPWLPLCTCYAVYSQNTLVCTALLALSTTHLPTAVWRLSWLEPGVLHLACNRGTTHARWAGNGGTQPTVAK